MVVLLDAENVPYIPLGDKYRIALERYPLSDEYKKTAQRELREVPEIVESALEELRELLKGEVDLHVLDSDEFLYKFLRPCKFYAKSAFDRMKRYYAFQVKNKNLFDGVIPSTERHSFAQGIVSFQPKRDKNGCRIVLFEVGRKWVPSVLSLWDLFKVVQLSLKAALEEPRTQVAGAVIMLDMQGLSLTQVYNMSPFFARVVLEWVQTCTPIRLKAVHVINQPFIFNMAFAIFKPFLIQKFRDRIHFHGSNRDLLRSLVGEESLRSCYGGSMEAPEYDGSLLCDLLCKYENEYIDANKLGYKTKDVIKS